MNDPVIVVSGLPRSGTSLAMQLLDAGGIEAMADGIRAPDPDNPRGYFEFERVKALRTDRAWLDDAGGKSVKVIHMLLTELPDDRPYAVLFMERDLDEVIASQATMLARSGKAGSALGAEKLKAVYQQQLKSVAAWLAARPNFKVLRIPHRDLVTDPVTQIDRVIAFLGKPLNREAMIRAVDPALYRNKK